MRALLLASATAASLVAGMGFAQTALAQQAAGSFQQSCRNTSVQNGVLTSECADTHGGYRVTSIPYTQCHGDIGNNNGALTCNGATASAVNTVPTNGGNRGQAPQNNNNDNGFRNNGGNSAQAQQNNNNDNGFRNNGGGQQYNNNGGQYGRNDNRGDNRGSTQLYAPGYSYPTFGDQRYGDPRFDPRYAQGGYAYGRQPNQWVPVADRARWLDQRIMRGQQEGTVDRREARGLRQELNGILSLENLYRREGMNPRKYADLDRRFDLLAARIQYERTDGDNRGVQR